MKNTSLGEFEELVLLVVGALGGLAYGVTILTQLRERTSKTYHISAVHMALRRLEEKECVVSVVGGITTDRGGRRKRLYAITPMGRTTLDEQFQLRAGLYREILKLALR